MTEGILQIAHKAAEDLRTLQKTRDFEYPGFFGFRRKFLGKAAA